MTDQTTAILLNMLVLEVMTQKGKMTSLDDKLDNVANDISCIKDLLQQLVTKVSVLEQREHSLNDVIPDEVQLLRRQPHSKEKDDLALLMGHLNSTLASNNITIDVEGAYEYLNNSAGTIISDLAPACYIDDSKSWKSVRPASKTAMINALTQQAKSHHIHLDRC
jgi:hypothetical protein